MIYTSYFAKIKDLPNCVIPIAISRTVPSFYHGLRYKKLAPTNNILTNWWADDNVERYVNDYCDDILNKLDPFKVVDELYALCESLDLKQFDICLICYEKQGSFCHRFIVSDWLNQHGFACVEFGSL